MSPGLVPSSMADWIAGHPAGLGVLVLGLADAPARRRPSSDHSPLGLRAGVVRDHRVGGVEDRLGRAVVLLEPTTLASGKSCSNSRMLRMSAPGRRRSTGPVADHDEVAMLCGQQRRPARTGRGWCPGTRRPARSGTAAGSARARRGWPRSRPTVFMIRSSKSMAFAPRQRRSYSLVHLGERLLEEAADPLGVGVGRQQLVLRLSRSAPCTERGVNRLGSLSSSSQHVLISRTGRPGRRS